MGSALGATGFLLDMQPIFSAKRFIYVFFLFRKNGSTRGHNNNSNNNNNNNTMNTDRNCKQRGREIKYIK
jgi:hypothetical protein